MSAAKSGSAKSDVSATASGGHLRVTQVRSGISTKPKHRATLRALGLRGVGRSRVLPDCPDVRGMLARVPHLITVAGAGALEAAEQNERAARARRARRASEGITAVVEDAPAPAKRARRATKELT
jgi:large subunit ribosomal protein L30